MIPTSLYVAFQHQFYRSLLNFIADGGYLAPDQTVSDQLFFKNTIYSLCI